MKRVFAGVLLTALLICSVACVFEQHQTAGEELTTPPDEPIAFSGTEFEPALILNGKKLNVYTQHYSISERYAIIPLTAFIESIGGYYASSSYEIISQDKSIECYELHGLRYVLSSEYQVFELEEVYAKRAEELTKQGKELNKSNLKGCSLLPADPYGIVDMQDFFLSWNGVCVDHRTLESAFRESGLDIRIESDFETQTIRVELSDSDKEASDIPDDPNRSNLRLKTHKWQGYTCLMPETFDIWEAMDAQLSATEEALLMWDTEALKDVGLVDMKYAVVAEKELGEKGFLTWYLDSEEPSNKAEEYKEKESREIAPGIISIRYEKGSSWVCVAKLRSDGTNALILAADSFTADGADDFDSIVKRFVMLNGD